MRSVVAAGTPGQRIVKSAAGRCTRDDAMGCSWRNGAGGEFVLHEVTGGGESGCKGWPKFCRVRAGARPCGAATPLIWHGEAGRCGLEVAREGGWRYWSREGDSAFDVVAELVFCGSRLVARNSRGRGLVSRRSGRGGDRGVRASGTTIAIGWDVPGRAVCRVGL